MKKSALLLSLALSATLFGCTARTAPTTPVSHATPSVSNTVSPPSHPPAQTTKNPEPIIQVALLLDTSSSMQGLIEQAKGQMWKVVNELGRANANGKPPRVQVALYEYGKTGLDQRKGFIRKISEFSGELDKISEELFALRCNGGEEYCGFVIQTAVDELQWVKEPNVYKAIFIAGNEPFTQGPIDFHQSCERARAKGILVNTIHCGQSSDAELAGWREGAAAGDGRYLAIDHNQVVAQVAAPQDKELAQLSGQLNQSYVPYGRAGEQALGRQSKMDAQNAELGSAVYSERVVAKASRSYDNSSWDLVDAVTSGKQEVSKLEASALPKEMQSLQPAEREGFVKKKQQERAAIQAKIRQLSDERSKFLAQQKSQTGTLDEAMVSAVKSQAESKGYVFSKS